MSFRFTAVTLAFLLAISITAPGLSARAATPPQSPIQDRETLLFLDKPELLRLAGQVEKLMNDTVDGVSGSETFVYLNAQWMQLVLNAALRQALVLEYIYEQEPGAGGKSIMEVMARDAGSLYLGYIEYNLRNINAMTAVYAGAGDDKNTPLFVELAAVYVGAANLYRDMESRRANYLSK